MSPVACPVCSRAPVEPAVVVGAVVVCALCGATLVLAPDGTVRRANGDDTGGLDPHDLQVLRTARGLVLRPEHAR